MRFTPKDFNYWNDKVNDHFNGEFILLSVGELTGHAQRQFTIKCKRCGEVKNTTISALNNKNKRGYCNACQKRDREQKELRARREKIAKVNSRILRRLVVDQVSFNFCECGAIIPDKRHYCNECLLKKNKAKAHRKDVKRRLRIRQVEQDKDITLEKLYERDKGICYICGCRCNWADSKTKGGAFIVGETYPTIEHVVPISLGGADTWNNIRLACWKCNTVKGARVSA